MAPRNSMGRMTVSRDMANVTVSTGATAPEIPVELNRLKETTELLNKCLDDLAISLVDICIPPGQSNPVDVQPTSGPSCNLANQLHVLVDNVLLAVEKTNDLRRRAQLN